jgi:hypothetical protein
MVLLLAGAERMADVDAALDFHATAPVPGAESPAVRWNAKKQDKLVADYLLARGAPKDILDAARRIGPAKVESLTTLEALDLHILTGVVDGDATVSYETLSRRFANKPRRTVRPAIYLDP